MSSDDLRIKDIEQQLAYVQWTKLRNERAICDTISTSKVMKQGDVFMKAVSDNSPDKKSWKATVLQDELNKSLRLTNEQLWAIKYERGAVSKGMDPEYVEGMFALKGLSSPSKESILLKQARSSKSNKSSSPKSAYGSSR